MPSHSLPSVYLLISRPSSPEGKWGRGPRDVGQRPGCAVRGPALTSPADTDGESEGFRLQPHVSGSRRPGPCGADTHRPALQAVALGAAFLLSARATGLGGTCEGGHSIAGGRSLLPLASKLGNLGLGFKGTMAWSRGWWESGLFVALNGSPTWIAVSNEDDLVAYVTVPTPGKAGEGGPGLGVHPTDI